MRNKIFPIIRYDLGDSVIIDHLDNNENIPYPLVKVRGRIYDVIKTPTGKEMTVHFFTYLFEYYGRYVSQFRVVQTSSTEVRIDIVTHADIPEKDLVQIQTELDEYSENSIKFIFNYVDFIAHDSSGKRKLLTSIKDQ